MTSDPQGKYVRNGIGRSVHSRTVDTLTSAASVPVHIQRQDAPVGAGSMSATTCQAPAAAMDTNLEGRNKLKAHTQVETPLNGSSIGIVIGRV